eukprot:scaffold83737_cov15-Tisochrysis_lutea.AAC.1
MQPGRWAAHPNALLDLLCCPYSRKDAPLNCCDVPGTRPYTLATAVPTLARMPHSTAVMFLAHVPCSWLLATWFAAHGAWHKILCACSLAHSS